MHTNLHLERVGDLAVNVAKITKATVDLPTNATVLSHLEEMADIAAKMVRTAMDAFARRDARLAQELPQMDDPIDHLNRGMYREVVALGQELRNELPADGSRRTGDEDAHHR